MGCTTVLSTTRKWNPSRPSPPLAPLAPPAGENDYVEFNFTIDKSLLVSGNTITRSLEIADPRNSSSSRAWVPWLPTDMSLYNTMQNANSLNAINRSVMGSSGLSKLVFPLDVDRVYQNSGTYQRPPIGFFSFVPTGMQRNLPGQTLKLQPSASADELPDWLLLDLLSPSVLQTGQAKLSPGGATLGKTNLNTKIYPQGGEFAPPNRTLPLQALLENLPNADLLRANILNNTRAGQDFGAPGAFDYVGEICEIVGVADQGSDDYTKESLIRNLASAITTQSNTFTVWGVAQTIKKQKDNTQPGVYQRGDSITGEKRFVAVVERYVWPGVDGLAGNAQTNANGSYNKLSVATSGTAVTRPGKQPNMTGGMSGKWEELDGPDTPTYPPATGANGAVDWVKKAASSYTQSSLDTAYNPVRAVMKYKVLQFKYLDD
jgi:hypothetical protein